jgi:hypothetical protein
MKPILPDGSEFSRNQAAFETLLGVHKDTAVPQLKRKGSPRLKARLSSICLGVFSFVFVHAISAIPAAAAATPQPVALASGWRLQDVAKVPQSGAQVSSAGFDSGGWYVATVPGTVLTTLVNDHVYPEPLYGENERPEIIPESLVHT